MKLGPNEVLDIISTRHEYKSLFMIFVLNVIRAVLKDGKRIYSKLPAKQVETQPWDTLCIDLIGKYQMTPNRGGREYAMKGKKDKAHV